MVKALKQKFLGLDEHTLEVARKSAASMVVKAGGLVVGMLVSIYLGRTLGSEGLGIVELSIRIASIMLVFTMFGMPNVLIKNIAIANSNQDYQKVSDNLHTALLFNGGLAFVLAVLIYLLSPLICLSWLDLPLLLIPLKIASIAVIPQTFSRIFASALNGLKKVWQSNLVNESLSYWTVALLLLILHYSDYGVDVVKIAWIFAISRIVVLLCIYLYWRGYFKLKQKGQWNLKSMIGPALPLLLVSGTSLIASNADAVMLGWLGSASDVGMYTVAARLATLMIFFLVVTNSAISPKLAAMYASSDLQGMQLMVQRVTKLLVLIALVFMVCFVLIGEFVLGFWGAEFREAYWVLLILGAGQFVNISTGCAGMLLVMCGYEKIHGYISLGSVCLNLVLNYFCITRWGYIGAALATAFTISIENLIKVYFARGLVGISAFLRV